MPYKQGRIARWTESPPREARAKYQVLYREYINGVIHEYRGKGDDRATARREAADLFHKVWGIYPVGYIEPTP